MILPSRSLLVSRLTLASLALLTLLTPILSVQESHCWHRPMMV